MEFDTKLTTDIILFGLLRYQFVPFIYC